MTFKIAERHTLSRGVQTIYENETDAPGFSLHVFYPFLTSAGNSIVKKYKYGVEIKEFPWEKDVEFTPPWKK